MADLLFQVSRLAVAILLLRLLLLLRWLSLLRGASTCLKAER